MSAEGVVRVAVVGDLHIGAPVNGCGDSAGGCQVDAYGQHPRTFAYYATEQLIDTMTQSNPDAVLITGDLFDRSDSSDRALQLAQRLLDELSEGGRPVAVIGGNHDAESDLPARLVLPRSVHWFSTQHPETLTLPELGLAVHGVSVRERDDLRQLFEQFPDPIAGTFNIAMLHTSLSGEWSKRACLPVPLDQLRSDNRYHAWALGHVHRRLQLGVDPLIVYPGGLHAKRDDGQGARGYAVFEIARNRFARVIEVDVPLNCSHSSDALVQS